MIGILIKVSPIIILVFLIASYLLYAGVCEIETRRNTEDIIRGLALLIGGIIIAGCGWFLLIIVLC